MSKPIVTCPNCQCVWDSEEIEDQSCGSCGYPDDQEFDPDYVGPDRDEPDMNGPTAKESAAEFAERMHYYQHYLK